MFDRYGYAIQSPSFDFDQNVSPMATLILLIYQNEKKTKQTDI